MKVTKKKAGKAKTASRAKTAPVTQKASGKTNGRPKTASRPSKSPVRQPALPGTEQIRSKTLDLCCEDIGLARDTMNRARLDEQGAIQRAMKHMLKDGTKANRYKHAGVELALVEGVDKLRVRLTKDATDTASVGNGQDVEDSPSDAPGEPEESQIH